MSAVAAAAALPRPRTFVGGAARRRLRSVPAQAGPVVPLKVGNPLQLTKTMRTRLLAAVRALLADPGLKGADDPVRLAAVVLMAKAKVATDYSARITATELGRWVGLKKSRVAHHVVPELRERGVLGSNETTNAAGWVTGLECWVVPMYRAQHGGDRRHALALSKVELIVLLKLVEALFAPGWTHEGGRVTPAGMLADRTGRGAATDRLGLLLMVLSSTSKGWLQLCSGSVDSERGRPAATVARLLGCSPAGGAKVLSRLQERDVLSVDRRETASGLNARSRVRLLPVAAAHGIAVRESRKAADAVFSDLAVTASGDLEAAVEAVTPVVTGVRGSGEGLEAASADRADAAHLHASHASVVTPGGSLSLSGGFSGEGRGAEGRRPERGCVREDQPVDGAGAAAGSASPVAEGGPLRGEQPEKASIINRTEPDCGDLAAVEAPSADTAGPGTRGRATLPPLDVRGVLGPVRWLWAKIERSGARTTVVRRTRAALDELAEIVGPDQAAPALTARLTRRLHDQGGEALVTDPAAWIIGRGLPQQHTGCGDARCDGGHRLDTNTGCEACADRHADRQALRRQAAAAVEARHPHLTGAARRTAIEGHLHTEVQHAALLRQARHDRQAAEREARRTGVPLPALRAWPGLDDPSGKSTCRECGARIVLAGPAAQDLLCGACHRESTTLAADSSAATPASGATPASKAPSACTQTDRRGRPCSHPPVPDHDVCVRHLAHALTGRPSS
ncbi:hypothetical protein [Streptomyces sp. PVA_94-07]|uniref:hypothetical protein n=1 Tax=Streptomyces sp. PVA_94-07 TaxID=1225337 RepID=UPI000688CE7F|nr:hypothetical protein [Streptomyces sp. PVA_94-07]